MGNDDDDSPPVEKDKTLGKRSDPEKDADTEPPEKEDSKKARIENGDDNKPNDNGSSPVATNPLTRLGALVDMDGTELTDEQMGKRLDNKRVALYFSAGWCPMCVSFEPALKKFRKTSAESNKPIELIYISSDRNAADQSKRTRELEMISVPHNKVAELKTRYKIWAGSECDKLGKDRRSGVPALVVLNKSGNEMAFVPAESEGDKALDMWDLQDKDGIWGE